MLDKDLKIGKTVCTFGKVLKLKILQYLELLKQTFKNM